MAKKENKDIPLEIVEIFRSGPKVPRIKAKDWEFLLYTNLRNLKSHLEKPIG